MGLVEQIRRAQLQQGLSTRLLLERSGLALERSNLHRKLTGKAPATVSECEALARALGIQLVYPEESAA